MSKKQGNITLKNLKHANATKTKTEAFDTEAMLNEAYTEIQTLRAQKPPSFQLRRLTKETSASNHLREMFLDGQANKQGNITLKNLKHANATKTKKTRPKN